MTQRHKSKDKDSEISGVPKPEAAKKEHAVRHEHSSMPEHEAHHPKHALHEHKPASSSHIHTEHARKQSISAEFHECISSFKNMKSLKALFVASFDVLFYVLALVFTLIFAFVMKNVVKPIEGIDPNLMLMSPDTATDIQSVLVKMVGYLIILIIVYALLLLLSYWFSRYLVWTTLLDKRFSIKALGKFLLLNIIWFAVIGILVFLIVLPIKSMSSSTLLMVYSLFMVFVPSIVLLYFTYLVYYIFTEREEIFSSLKDTFILGVRHFKQLWFPAVMMFALFVVVSLISMLSNFMPNIVSDIYVGVLLVAVLTWMKLYAASVLKRHVRV
ncbi:MAG: hypothetical protein KKE20_06080 [Nanoarchaeota archaeon]|nr:hypothetical protein [Nanoarchaeota archaeon]